MHTLKSHVYDNTSACYYDIIPDVVFPRLVSIINCLVVTQTVLAPSPTAVIKPLPGMASSL